MRYLPNSHLHNLSFSPYAQWLDKADYPFYKEPSLQPKFLKYYMLICGDHTTLQPMTSTSISSPFVNDYSRCTWIHLLRCNNNALQTIQALFAMVKNQFSTKTIRTDNGTEFTNLEATFFFQSWGVVRQRTCPYTPQQNGVVDRKHKCLLETTRALLYQSKLPLQYWGECIFTCTYIINRLPSFSLKGKCHLELHY